MELFARVGCVFGLIDTSMKGQIMTTARLSADTEARLSKLSILTHRPKSFYIREAISQYLEDMEDAYIALERLSDPKRKLLTTDEMLKEIDNV